MKKITCENFEDILGFKIDENTSKQIEDFDLTKDEQDNIHSYYRDMLNYDFEKRNTISQSYFHTLQKSGYIKNATQENRDEKLGELING